jgi:hypothetical protein
MSRPLVLVDAENVRRSRWPNVGREELVRLAEEWAGREGVDVEVVFERPGLIADDAIAARAAELAAEGRPYWLATSDRGLRERAAAGAARVIGGGAFVRELTGDTS